MQQTIDPRKERLGAFIHHPAISLGVAVLIVISVSLVLVKLLVLAPDDPWGHTIDVLDLWITGVFVVELGIKCWVAPNRLRFLGQYWIDIIAIIPWAHSLRVLRLLRLLRVFRVAMILSRRFRFVSALFRSAVGEYVVLAMMMFFMLGVGTFGLYLSERHARAENGAVADVDDDPSRDLSQPENAFWATLFFLVATEPMVAVPQSPVGKGIVLVVMFGGLTTFAVFTGIVTALMVNRLKRRMEIDDMDRFQLYDHLLILGWNRLVALIIEELTAAKGNAQAVVVVADLEEPPPEVANQVGSRVFFVRGDYTKPAVLEQARVRQANKAIIVADDTIERSDQDRDARTVLGALMVERMNPEIYTCAELLNRDNEQHLLAAGIEEVITTSEAGGHHLAMAAMHAGLSHVVTELMTRKVGRNLQKAPVPEALVGLDFPTALDRYKREHDGLLVGVEVKGQEGPKAEGYAMQVNPGTELVLGATDNLVLIGNPS
jgi:voltage-gated potassium channel